MLRLSIVVPVYNVEKYLEQCISSLLNQDIPLNEYEIICVEDKSTDSSGNILARLESENPNIRVVWNSKNIHQGGARNVGVEIARGNYIWFVDSDDFVFPNVLSKMMEEAEASSIDILLFDYQSDRIVPHNINNSRSMNIMSGEEMLFGEQGRQWIDILAGPWRQLFKRTYLLDNKISFIDNAAYEDTDYLLKAYLLSNSVKYLPSVSYYYRRNSSSVTNSEISPQKMVWMINQMDRCAALAPLAKEGVNRGKIISMVADTVCYLRTMIAQYSVLDRIKYLLLTNKKWINIRPLVSKKTWLAIRFGIILF